MKLTNFEIDYSTESGISNHHLDIDPLPIHLIKCF